MLDPFLLFIRLPEIVGKRYYLETLDLQNILDRLGEDYIIGAAQYCH